MVLPSDMQNGIVGMCWCNYFIALWDIAGVQQVKNISKNMALWYPNSYV